MIYNLILNSLWIFGFWVLFQPGMILFKIDDWLCGKIDVSKRWLFKPIYVCPPCMASIHGAVGFYFTEMEWIMLPVYLVALTGLNYIVNQIIHG